MLRNSICLLQRRIRVCQIATLVRCDPPISASAMLHRLSEPWRSHHQTAAVRQNAKNANHSRYLWVQSRRAKALGTNQDETSEHGLSLQRHESDLSPSSAVTFQPASNAADWQLPTRIVQLGETSNHSPSILSEAGSPQWKR